MICTCVDCQRVRRRTEPWVHVPERLHNLQQVGETLTDDDNCNTGPYAHRAFTHDVYQLLGLDPDDESLESLGLMIGMLRKRLAGQPFPNRTELGDLTALLSLFAAEREHSARLTERIGVLEDENAKLRDQLNRSDNELDQLRGRL